MQPIRVVRRLRGAAWIVGLTALLAAAAELPAVEYFVAPEGADSNPGTQAAPFRTIERARTVVRAANAKMTADIVVNLRAGTYRLAAPLVFGARDGGTNGHDVIYRAYEKEAVVISGGRPVTGWKDAGKGIFQASAGKGVFRQLFVDGQWAVRARTPNAGSFNRLQNWDRTHKAIDINAAEAKNWSGLTQVEIVTVSDWQQGRFRLASVAVSGGSAKLGLQQPEADRVFILQWPQRGSGDPYFLENSRDFLDAPGEWYLDAAKQQVFLLPPAGVDLAKAEVIAPTLERLVEVSGASRIQFQGLTFEHTTWLKPSEEGYVGWQSSVFKAATEGHQYHGMTAMPSAVHLEGAKQCRFERCTFRNLGGGGLWLKARTDGNVVNACTFQDIAGCAVTVGDVSFQEGTYDVGAAEAPKNDQITNNTVTRVAKDYTGSVGIFAMWCQGTVIDHNEVSDLPYTGISVGWGWTPQVTSLRNNKIRNNHVHHVMQLHSDGAGIYFLSRQEGTEASENYVHDVVKSPWARNSIQAGMYTDQGSGAMTFNNNVIETVSAGWHHNQESGGHTGNWLTSDPTTVAAVKAKAGPKSAPVEPAAAPSSTPSTTGETPAKPAAQSPPKTAPAKTSAAVPAKPGAAVPIEVTGWNQDLIFEAGPTSAISQFFAAGDKMTFVEEGLVTGVKCIGFPAHRTFTSPGTGNLFTFQPYNQNNAFWLMGNGWLTATLKTPRKYKSISLLQSGQGFHANWLRVTVKLKFTDHPDVELLWLPDIGVPVGRTFQGYDWGPGGAVMSMNYVSHTGMTASQSNPVQLGGGGMRGVFETQIPLAPYKSEAGFSQNEHLENFTLSAITMGKGHADNSMFFACFAISGVPTEPAAPANRSDSGLDKGARR